MSPKSSILLLLIELFIFIQCWLIALMGGFVEGGGVLLINPASIQSNSPSSNSEPKLPTNCDQIIANGNVENDKKVLICQLYESTTLLTQLVKLVSQGLDRLMIHQGVLPTIGNNNNGEEEIAENIPEPTREKKKHEYLRFGKRKHEYLRFGKRKHEYLRFG